ncbi:DUF3568 domain-containing protein [Pseudomonas saliphila]|nr:DUF3568 domain-containing protein [Pseudomonas saliphila]
MPLLLESLITPASALCAALVAGRSVSAGKYFYFGYWFSHWRA